jgi:UDP-2,3-diacylglucosamine hydrolase
MAMATFFLSDIHLGLGPRDIERAKEDRLLAFLRAITPEAQTLFILGDLFDFWFEYRTVIPKGFHRTLSALQSLTENGTAVHYLAGNHDFWMDDFFPRELGIEVHTEAFEVAIDGKRVHLHHGDGLASNDLGYRLIKPVLRNPLSIWLYRWLHPDIGVRLARGSSRTSREYTTAKDYGEEEGMLSYAGKRIAEGCDIVVMGHRHQPSFRELPGGVYVNLGDWITANTFARMDNGSIALKTWNGAEGRPDESAAR